MSARTTMTFANGAGFDVLHPTKADIHWPSVAEHLAKENRYNGATPGVAYSVAEHSVRCADAALRMTEDRMLAAYLLVHDCHEGAGLKDIPTPTKRALAEVAKDFGILADEVKNAFANLTDRHDVAIHAAAGLNWPVSVEMAAAIKRFDLILFRTEWRDLMHDGPHPDWEPYRNIEPLPEKIVPMPWQEAQARFIRRAEVLLPISLGYRP